MFSNGPQHVFDNNITVHNLGSTSTDMNWGDKKLVCDVSYGACYVTTASTPNFPVAHTIGEIQSNTVQGLTDPTTSSFIIANGLCEGHSSDSAIYPVCPRQPATASLFGQALLPHFYDNIYWSASSDGYMHGVMGTYQGLMMEIQGNGNFVVETEVEMVCPEIEGYEVGGAWGEYDEAVLSITAYSSCLAGTCILSTEDPSITLYSQHLDLGVDPSIMTLRFTSTKKKLSFGLKCTSVIRSATIYVEGELDDPTPIEPIGPGGEGTSFNEWFSDLSLGGKIGLFFGLVIFAITSVVVVLASDYLISWCIRRKMGYRKAPKDESLDDMEMESLDDYTDTPTAPKPVADPGDDVGGPMERLRSRMARLAALRR